MTKKILHLISDEKFPDFAYDVFEHVLPNSNFFLLPDIESDIKYLKRINPIRVKYDSYNNSNFIDSIKNYDLVVLHSLNHFNLEVVSRSDMSVNFLWIGFGFDYYDLVYPKKSDLLQPMTRAIIEKMAPNILQISNNILVKLAKNIRDWRRTIVKKEIISKIKWFSPVLESEYLLIKDKFKGNRDFPEYIDWNYEVVADLASSNLKTVSSKSGNILVGNSACPNNNHIDAFNLLNDLKLRDDLKIIVPLSYGDSRYTTLVKNEGKKIFGNNFQPILDYMPLNEYNKMISSCSVVIMNHNRQQAGGNIAAGLIQGSKLFVNKKNGFYSYYKKLGVELYDIQDLNQINFESIFSIKSVEKNRAILKRVRSFDSAIQKTTNLLKKTNIISTN